MVKQPGSTYPMMVGGLRRDQGFSYLVFKHVDLSEVLIAGLRSTLSVGILALSFDRRGR